jgi:hypothetical protein
VEQVAGSLLIDLEKQNKLGWLNSLISNIEYPLHNTFGEVFAVIDTEPLGECFSNRVVD